MCRPTCHYTGSQFYTIFLEYYFIYRRVFILVSLQNELPGNSRAIPTRQSLQACGRTGSSFVWRLMTWDPWRLCWPSQRCLPQGAQAGGRSRIQRQLTTTAWGRATQRPQPTTQKASLTRWQSGGQADVITLPWSHAVTVGCHLILEGRRKGPPVFMSLKRNSPWLISFTSVLVPLPRTKVTSRKVTVPAGYTIPDQKLPPTQQFPTVSNLAYGNSCVDWKGWVNIKWHDTTPFLMCLHIED